jgi:cytochrome c biogenesis protein CcmG/thiol:disulfide interchange protein DsbE
MQNQLDGATERGGHWPFQPRGQGFQRRRLGADQSSRFRGRRVPAACVTTFGAGMILFFTHRFLMVSVFAACGAANSIRPAYSYNKAERPIAVKRNTLVFSAVLFILAAFAWAGWANYEYRKQAAERLRASAGQGEPASDASGAPQDVPSLLGRPAPQFSLEDLSGKKVSLASYKGRALVINFWATWCAPCKVETPWLIELRNRYATQGLEVLGISADDIDRGDPQKLSEEKQEIARFVQKMQMPYPVLIDADSISKPYGGLDSLPTSFFVDRNGTVVAAQQGLTSKDELERSIKKALGN